jgi:hypothetical protein
MERTELAARARDDADRKALVIRVELGSGVHGIVFSAEYQSECGESAIKVHEREPHYARERDVYLRLQQHRISQIGGSNVPQLIAFDDDLWIIEMTVVARPFVLDFAGAFLDRPPDFSEEVLAEWRAEKQEQFGPRWRAVLAILAMLETYGIFLVDVNPGNVAFSD